MCGIVTMILKDQAKVLGPEYSEMFKQMLHADAVRGWDSTGIACIKHSGDVHIVKDALVPSDLFAKVPDNTWIFQNRAYIGHNRWATRGKLIAANAHPFQEGKVSLVHNGTLRFHMFLKNVEVDSHAITHAISEKGAIDTLEVLDGAYALVWHDQTTGNIHATRNEERPLFLLETEDLYLLSSERGLIYWICERFKVKVRKCTPLTPGILYTFRANKKKDTIVEQTKYKILEPVEFFYQPPLPARLPAVSRIQPYQQATLDDGLKVGHIIELTPVEGKDLGYTAFGLGSFRWSCVSLEWPDHKFEVYTANAAVDLTGQLITASIKQIYRNYLTPTIVAKLEAVVEKAPPVFFPTGIKSSNGVLITPAVVEIVKDCLCTSCTGPFEFRSDIVLIPVYRNNHLYKYTYYCPDCTEIVQPQKLRALH